MKETEKHRPATNAQRKLLMRASVEYWNRGCGIHMDLYRAIFALLESDKRQRAKLRDVTARLRAVRALENPLSSYGDGVEYKRSKAFSKALRRITDCRKKDWRRKS